MEKEQKDKDQGEEQGGKLHLSWDWEKDEEIEDRGDRPRMQLRKEVPGLGRGLS